MKSFTLNLTSPNLSHILLYQMQMADVLHRYPIIWFLCIIQVFNLLKVLFHYRVMKGYVLWICSSF